MKKPIFLLVLLATILISANMTMAQMFRIKVQATGEYLRLDQQSNEIVSSLNPPNDSSSWFILVRQPDKTRRIMVSVNGKYLREDEQSGKIISTDNIGDDFSKFLFIKNPSGKGFAIKIIGSRKVFHSDKQGVKSVTTNNKLNANNVIFVLERVRLQSRTKYDPANEVTFFAEENYTGERLAFYSVGDYPSMGKYNFNDKVSSIKLGSNVVVQVCEHNNFNGKCEYLSENASSLNSTLIKNKQISSYRLLTKEMASRFIKLEETKDDPPSSAYILCAKEGGRCRFGNVGKMVRVAYGSYGRFKYKYFNTQNNRSTQCSISSFGNPNSKGPNKCFVLALALDPNPSPIPTPTPIRVTPITTQDSTSTMPTEDVDFENMLEPVYGLRNGNKCVEVNGVANYSPVKLSSCNSNSNQKWVFVESSNSPTLGEIRTYENKCLTRVSESRGYVAMLNDCDNGSSQQWQKTNRGELKRGSKCLNSNTTGDFIPLTNCSGALNQIWRFTKVNNSPVAQSNTSTSNSSNKNSARIPVVMPAGGSFLRLVNSSLSNNSMLHAYLRERLPGNIDAGYGSPASRSSIRIVKFDFALSQQTQLFYIKSNYDFYKFDSQYRNEIRSVGYSSPSKLVKIGGTDLSPYRQAGKLRYNTNLYALTADGRIVRATFDAGSQTLPSQISFSSFTSNVRFRDIASQPSPERMLALTTDSRLLAYSNKKWTELARTNFVKFTPNSYTGKIFGLTANNQLFIADNNGKNSVKLLDDVKDFSVSEQGLIYHVSSKTNLLMKTRLSFGIGGNYKKVIGTNKADEKGTFVRFITKKGCVVQNGNGQVFTCQ